MTKLPKNIFIKIFKKAGFIFPAILVASALIFLYGYFFSAKVGAAWFDENWLYRQAITMTVTSSSSDISNLETLLTVNTSTLGSSKLQSACQDLRFTSTGGKALPYYLASSCDNSTTTAVKIWVQADLVPKNTTTYTLYMYYGNPTAQAGSDSNKFRLFNGLVGYWNMNEASWTGDCSTATVKDLSGNANNGTACPNTSAPTITSSGKYANAGTFDGSNDTVSIPDTDNIDFAYNQNFSLSFWVKDGGTNANGDAIVEKWSGTGGYSYVFRFQGNSILFGRYDGTNNPFPIGSTAITGGTWHHVIGVKDGSTLRLYIDGAADGTASDTTTGTTTNASAVFIASRGGTGQYYKGDVDELRIYNRAFSASEVTQLYNDSTSSILTAVQGQAVPSTSFATEEQGPGPAAYWKFDDGQGTTTQDSAPSNNDGILSGTTKPTWTTEDQCISGKCLYFNGSTAYTAVSDNTALKPANITVSTWVRTPGVANSFIFYKYNPSSPYQGYGLALDASNNPRFWVGGNAWTAGTIAVNDNKWHYLVATYDGTNVRIYIDGVLNKTNAQTATLSYTINATIGAANSGASDIFKGYIDELKIYSYARTAAQVKQDYLAGKANAGTKQGTSAVLGSKPEDWLSNGLVGYWKMNETAANTCTGGVNDSCDSSGNSRDGAWNGNTANTTGKYGNGTSYDGTGDYISMGNVLSFERTNPFSIGVWVKSAAGGSGEFVVAKWDNDNAGEGYGVTINANGTISFHLANNQSTNAIDVTGNVNVRDNTWHNIFVTYDGSSNANGVKIYSDGTQNIGTISNNSLTATTVSADPFQLGCREGCSFSDFNGSIDETRIYNRALSPKEVSDLYNWAPGPKVQLNMEEGSGTSANDSSGNSNNGTVNSSTWTTGKYGKGVQINGSSGSNISIPDFSY